MSLKNETPEKHQSPQPPVVTQFTRTAFQLTPINFEGPVITSTSLAEQNGLRHRRLVESHAEIGHAINNR